MDLQTIISGDDTHNASQFDDSDPAHRVFHHKDTSNGVLVTGLQKRL